MAAEVRRGIGVVGEEGVQPGRRIHAEREAVAADALRFVDHHGRATEAYPYNPNGSPGGLTAVTTADGRFTALMPHPERVLRNVQMSWSPGDRSLLSPWGQAFWNARRALG